MTKENKIRINQLVEQLSLNNLSAFDELYAIIYEPLFCFLKRYQYNDDIVKEAISETFSYLIDNAQTRLFFINCYSWILTIAKNKLRNISRKEHSDNVSLDELVNVPSEKYYCDQITDRLILDSITSKLPIQDQRLLTLIYQQDLNYAQISRIMKISKSTIIRRHKEIKLYIKENFKDEWIQKRWNWRKTWRLLQK